MPSNSISFAQDWAMSTKFCQPEPKKTNGLAQMGTWELGAGQTLHHHSFDPYGGHEMVQQHHKLSHASKQHQFCPRLGGYVTNLCQPEPSSGMAWHRWVLGSWSDTASSLI
jgi:hypothetical protein